MSNELEVTEVTEHILDLCGEQESETCVLLQTIVELDGIEEQIFHDGASLAIRLNLLLTIEEDLAPEIEVSASVALRPVPDQSVHSFGQRRVAERASQELIQSGFRTPCDKTLLLKHQLALSQLTLKHTSCSLHLSQLQVVNKLGEKLIQIQSV